MLSFGIEVSYDFSLKSVLEGESRFCDHFTVDFVELRLRLKRVSLNPE